HSGKPKRAFSGRRIVDASDAGVACGGSDPSPHRTTHAAAECACACGRDAAAQHHHTRRHVFGPRDIHDRGATTSTPAVACSLEATLPTGLLPRDHGIVANGWLFRGLMEVWFWRQSNRLV